MKFLSRYSNGKEVTIRQYTIEIICENKARFKKIDLPTRFWTLKEWADYYKSQLRRYDSLSKSHSANKILAFIKRNNLYSLHAKWIDEALDVFQFEEPSSNIEEEIDRSNVDSTGSSFVRKNNILDRLE